MDGSNALVNEDNKRPSATSRKLRIVVIVLVAVLAVIIIGVAIGVPLSKRGAKEKSFSDPEQAAHYVLKTVPLIDGHNDLAWQFWKNSHNQMAGIDLNKDMRTVWNDSHTDIPRLRKGMLGAQFWAVYVSCKLQFKDAVRATLDQFDMVKRFVGAYPETFQMVGTADELLSVWQSGKIASLIGVEGGHSIDNSLATVRMFYDLGARYMTLTHNCHTAWARSWIDHEAGGNKTEPLKGLSEFGKSVVRTMNRVGMMVDLSHVSVQTMLDALDTSRAPVMYSHSSAWTLCGHYRNVQDHVLQKVKEKAGVVMVNFYDVFVKCDPRNETAATLEHVADHIEHIRNVASVDNVGIGSDYDGIDGVPVGLEDVSTFPALFTELARRGWTVGELKKLAGGNILRVMREVEQVSSTMMSEPVGENLIPTEELLDRDCRLTPDWA